MKTAVGYYFSVDDNPFNIADLLTVYSVDEKGEKTDVTADVHFEYDSPAALYDAKQEAYVESVLQPIYKDGTVIDGDTVKVYVGIKGDTNLNADNDINDAESTLFYYSYIYAGAQDVKFYDLVATTVPHNDEIETLMYFLSDIDTEGKGGKNDDTHEITNNDALWNLFFYSYRMAGGERPWKEICPTLTKDSPLAK